ncbi:hypothetical protein [Longimicrobium terrae]|uniref:O-antigen ligase family protein n=1 Tax=Longimicrobium terrae TaxID=1639882 RepID=A0A841H5M2_9BACT|nr:hypothetical protein [Longimicrobium terrae]MBB4638993.1 hypothetical protein [Longimicrobium terrae]MBB6073232.1 hypothetical protein [Longimicrobium terrae]NNC32317.1 hypothetical protein [Longimicrobium terrae]
MNTAARMIPATRVVQGRPPKKTFAWVPAFIIFQLLCQLALIVGDIGWARVIVRIAAFGASLLLVFGLRGRGSGYPAAKPAIAALAAVGICIFHPETRSLMAGVAQVALYLAVLGPVFWVPRLTSIDLAMLRRAVMVLWAFHTASAALGVLQVYRPGTFQPPVSAVVESKGKGYVESLKITTASGERVFRPMGLTDVPGGASISGLYAVLLGVGFFLTRKQPLALAASLGSIGLGVMTLYLSQVRALVVMTGIALVAVAAVLLFRRDVKRLSMLMVGVVGVVVAGYLAAVNMAGAAVAQRMASLVASKPGQVYYDNRGRFLEDALTKTLPRAPMGEGLGHWGMTSSYFGGSAPQTKNIWVEIQWAGWIVDGGAPFLLLYLATLAVALWTGWGIARSRPPSAEAADLPFWGAIVLAYSIGATALTFSYPIFLSQSGMEFWLLNATLFAAARHARLSAAAARG